ncbi:Uncharacterised protein g2705 [Pycnogonum litorale]
MFKLESYVTPLILSYVDKYVKNLKPEDSQLSLWGGDAVFSNLDLRLDVLEDEVLQLPLTFVSGHIHELRIHVPWTKLISESIVITINTIECILKLRNSDDVDEESSTSSSVKSSKGENTKKKAKKPEVIDVPPGYVRSIINKILNNVKIICNNVILKYVEDDIVLSLNVKSAEFFSVNEKWKEAFVDLSLPELALRKFINLTDLTVCLDKRNASGCIEVYQDPLLYKCSLSCRLYSRFKTLHAKQPSVLRFDVFCNKLDFSVTDEQVPMLIRLFQLVLALYFQQLNDKNDSTISSNANLPVDDLKPEEMMNNESWSSWAWSFVPSLLDESDEDDDVDVASGHKRPSLVSQYSIYVNDTSVIFKLSEIVKETPLMARSPSSTIRSPFNSCKINFQPFMELRFQGTGFEAIIQAPDFSEIQFGIATAKMVKVGECVCGIQDTIVDSHLNNSSLIVAGNSPKKTNVTYLKSSLFDPTSDENEGRQKKYILDWDACVEHEFNSLSIGYSMWDRYGAFMLHNLYTLNLPHDWQDGASEISLTESYLETSNHYQRALCRIIVGDATININSSLVHRLQKLLYCTKDCDSNPYGVASDDLSVDMSTPYTTEEIKSVEDPLPRRTLQLSVLRPTVKIYVANHPSFDAKYKKVVRRSPKIRSESNRSNIVNRCNVELPLLVLTSQEIDFQYGQVMYPRHVTKAALSNLSKGISSEKLFHNCYSHTALKVYDMEVSITNNSYAAPKICLVPSCNGVGYFKQVLLPEALTENSVRNELQVELSEFSMHITKPELYLLTNICTSWIVACPDPTRLTNTSLLSDVLSNESLALGLKLQIIGVDLNLCSTAAIRSLKASVNKMSVKLQQNEKVISLFHGPEDVSSIYSTSYFSPTKSTQVPSSQQRSQPLLPGMASSANTNKFIDLVIQLPLELKSFKSDVYVVSIHVQGFTAILEPALLRWLNYQPKLTDEGYNIVIMKTDKEDLQRDMTKVSSASSVISTSEMQSPSYTASAPPTSTGPASSVKKESSEPPDRSKAFIRCSEILNYVQIQIQLESSCIFVPSRPLGISANQDNVASSVRYKLVGSLQNDTINQHLLVMCLPMIQLHSVSVQRHFQSKEGVIVPTGIPVMEFVENSTSVDQFPWTFEISNLSVYTFHRSSETMDAKYIINPISLSSSVAVNAKTHPNDSTSDKKHVAFCVHADMQALHFNCSFKQVELISELGVFIASFIPLLTRPPDLISDLRHSPSPIKNVMSPVSPIIPNLKKQHGFIVDPTNVTSTVANSIEEEGSGNERKSSDRKSDAVDKHNDHSLSLWLQWTLPKFCINLFSNDGEKDEWLMFELEELTTSFDIQDVYRKIKTKIGAFNVTDFYKRSADEEWHDGSFGGILLSCTDRLSRNLVVPDVNSGIEQIMPHSSMFEAAETSNHGFLTATFIQVLSSNVQTRFCQTSDKRESSVISSCQDYVTEIDFKVQPVDVVLRPSIILSAASIFHPLVHLISTRLPYTSPPNDEERYPIGWNFCNRNLPLVHINTCTVRVFVVNHVKQVLPNDSGKKDDCLMLQIDSVVIVPEAVNPLQRHLLLPKVYNSFRKMHRVPGSPVEDRQYQLDINGISASTAIWNDFLNYEKSKNSKLQVGTATSLARLSMGENPALEWNTKGLMDVEENKDIVLRPIISRFDLQVTLAPAIICTKHDMESDTKNELLVCGSSAEVNVTNDMIISVSLDQVALIKEIIESNVNQLSSGGQSNAGVDLKDSGVDSEVSSAKQNDDAVEPVFSSDDVDSKRVRFALTKNKEFVPFDLLLTAGSIVFLSYFDESNVPDWSKINAKYRSKDDKGSQYRRKYSQPIGDDQTVSTVDSFKQTQNVKNKLNQLEDFVDDAVFNVSDTEVSDAPSKHYENVTVRSDGTEGYDGYDGSDDSCLNDDDDDNTRHSSLYPFVFILFSQPHTYLQCHPCSQKLEMSCFDLSLSGSHGFRPLPADRLIPKKSDFKVSWIETKAGKPNKVTGIPPSLFTLTVIDFIHKSGKVNIRIERPVKFNISLQKIEQTTIFSSAVASNLKLINPDSCSATKKSNSSLDRDGFAPETIVQDVSIKSGQIVVVMETVSHQHVARFICSLTKLSTHVDVDVKESSARVCLDNLLIVTDFKSTNSRMVGPCSKVYLKIASNKVENQQLFTVTLKCCCLPVKVSQESFECLKSMVDTLSKHTLVTRLFETKENDVDESKLRRKSNQTSKHEFDDDLRKGLFRYIQHNDGVLMESPGVYEIVFNVTPDHRNPASMSWTYPEPRYLNRMQIYPIPFNVPTDVSSNASNEILCCLQFWDVLQERYVTCKLFVLYEATVCEVDLPNIADANHHKVPISASWRIQIDVKRNNGYDVNNRVDSDAPRLSPLTLAACTRVDSTYDPLLLPSFQCSIVCELIHVTFYYTFDSTKLPSRLWPYEFDQTMPACQELGVVSIDGFSSTFNQWCSSSSVQASGDTSVRIMDYHSLSLINMIDPFTTEANFSFRKDDRQPDVSEYQVLIHPLYVRCGNAMVHTLNVGIRSWAKLLSKHELSPFVPTYYVICNNTCGIVKFGQMDTEESVSIDPRQMHCYTWRSLRSKLIIKLCMRGTDWSNGFAVDDVVGFDDATSHKSIQSLNVLKKGTKVHLIVTVKRLTETQKQIIIEGQLLVQSRFGQRLELQIFKSNGNDNKKRSKPYEIVVGRKSQPPSMTVDPNDIKHVRVKLMDVNGQWSTEVQIHPGNILLQLPSKNQKKAIEVWLTVLTETCRNVSRYLLLFTPLYVLRSHLPQSLVLHISTPSNVNNTNQMIVCGQGREHDIVIESLHSDVTHQLNFQIGDGKKLSSPSLPLSPSMVDQITSSEEIIGDLDTLMSDWLSKHQLMWPYVDDPDREVLIDDVGDVDVLSGKLHESMKPSHFKPAPQHPNIELKVDLIRRWPSCNALLIDVKPAVLVINKTELELAFVLWENGKPENWAIPVGTVFTPPKLKGSFRLGVQVKETLFISDPLQLSAEDWSLKNYWPNRVKGIIPARGNVNIVIDVKSENSHRKCQLTIRTVYQESIQVIAVCQSYYVCNESGNDINVFPVCVPVTGAKKNLRKDLATSISHGECLPIRSWATDGKQTTESSADFTSYITVAHLNVRQDDRWSVPTRLPVIEDSNCDIKTYVVVPNQAYGIKSGSTTAYNLTCHVDDGICYVFVKPDRHPSFVLHNNCNVALSFGQSSSGEFSAYTVIEEEESIDCIPYVLPNSSTQYTFPETNMNFPRVVKEDGIVGSPKLHFRRRFNSDAWSNGVDVDDHLDQFVTIPDACDARITKQKVGHSLHLRIEPIHRALILAKDVRSRLQLSKVDAKPDVERRSAARKLSVPVKKTHRRHLSADLSHRPVKKKKSHSRHSSLHNLENPDSSPRKKTDQSDRPVAIDLNYVTLLSKHVCVVLVDETVSRHTEVIRFSVDDLSCIVRPAGRDVALSSNRMFECFVDVRDVQLDNQLCDEGFDFPVVLTSVNESAKGDLTLENLSVEAKNSSSLHLSTSVEYAGGSFVVHRVHVQSLPLSIYVEDKFLYRVLSVVRVMLPSSRSKNPSESYTAAGAAPRKIRVASDVISRPIRLESIRIDPVRVKLSIHASIKLYLSVDCALLSFKAYERRHLYTDSYRLGHDVTMHYLSGALLKAGWFVASLDLLGNPAGLARSFGAGITKFVSLPYEGLFRGPWGFVVGISHGSASLVKHVTSGTIASVTNLASSVSKNMDRLSLDTDHVLHQEQLRKNRPDSLYGGLFQGLSSFGYSVLGAVAGLVDKPIQNIIKTDATPVNAVSGVVSGFSKGMIGVVTKPIGGAAEFVAQTGQGLLDGAGWSITFNRRYDPYTTSVSAISTNSNLKYHWKMIGHLSGHDVIHSIDATHVNQSGVYVSCTLLLTSEALFIINERDDSRHQAYALTEIVCRSSPSDPMMISVETRHSSRSVSSQRKMATTDRITEFVYTQDQSSIVDRNHTSDHSETVSDSSAFSSDSKTMFYVHPKHSNTFLTLFRSTQNKILNSGFNIW